MLTAVIRSRCHARISVRAASTLTMLVATMLVALLLCPQGYTQSQPAQQAQNSFPDTDPFITRVAQHQKDLESLLSQYTLHGPDHDLHAGQKRTSPKPTRGYLLHHANTVRVLHPPRQPRWKAGVAERSAKTRKRNRTQNTPVRTESAETRRSSSQERYSVFRHHSEVSIHAFALGRHSWKAHDRLRL